MKISSWLFGLQKLYQAKINSPLGQHPKTNNSNLIFSQAKSQIDEEQLLRKALNNKQLSSAEQQHLANNPMLQTKIELKKLENLKKKLDRVLYKTGNITSTDSLLIGNGIYQKRTFVLNYRFKKQEFEKIQALFKLQGFLKN